MKSKLTNDIVSTITEDKPLIYISEEAINLKRDNDRLKKEIERLNNKIKEINSIIEYWGYDKEHNDISSFRMAMKSIKDILGSDK